MTYRLIESLDFERSITVGTLILPAIAIVEDDDGIRLLLTDSSTILGRHWAKASASGVAVIVRPLLPLPGGGWEAQSTDTFLEGRSEVAARGVFIAPERWLHFDHAPGLREMAMATLAPPPQGKGFVQLHCHSEFCLAPEVKVCTADLLWKPIGEVEVGEHLVGFGEDLRPPPGERGNSRSKMERAVVTHVKRVVQPCYRITLEDGVSIVASAQHGWVVSGTTRGSLVKPGGFPSGWGSNTRRWLTTEKLATGRKMPRLIMWARPWESEPVTGLEREAAWLAGVLDGEGWLHNGQLQLGQNPGLVWDEIHRVCKVLGYSVTADRVQSKKGPCRTFRFAGYETAMRVLSQCRPVRFAGRTDEVWAGRRAGGTYSRPVQIRSVEFLGDRETVAITTSTKTFVAEGFLSHNSPLDGLSRIHEMVAEAKADGQQALGLTDHGVCAGHPELQILTRKAEIKPVFGLEAYLVDDRFARPDPKPKATDFPTLNAEGFAEVVDRWKVGADLIRDYYHLILWARTDEGLANLWAMSTEAHRDGFYSHPRLDWDTLDRYHEGVMAATACLRGPLNRPILQEDTSRLKSNLGRLQGVFGDYLFAEIGTPNLADQRTVNEALIGLAHEHSLPLIATTDAHYPCHHHKAVHSVWMAAQTNKELQDETGLFEGDTDYHMMAEWEVRDALSYLPEAVVDQAIANTAAVADLCTAEVRGETHMPLFSKQGGIPRDRERAVEICMAAWEAKTAGKSHSQDEYIARFEKEARLLSMKGFWGYYLIVWDYVRYARDHRVLVGPGRGSGGGSLIAYLMGIVGIDPVECDLIFERFLTEGRDSPPDFDIDFPTSKRDFMTDYVTEKYGSDSVVRVGTHTRLKNKGVIASLFRVLKNAGMDLDFGDQKKMSDLITRAEAHTAGLGLSWEALWDQHGDQLDQYRAKYPELFGYADMMVGRLKSYGRHAAGLVIASDRTLADRLPMRMAGDKDNRQLVSDFPMDAMELLGLLKFDFLTLRTLDTIQVCIDMIEAKTGRYIEVDGWSTEYDDPQVWEEVANGKTLGIFQIETVAGTRLTKHFGPRSISDLADVITLVRPGPKNSGLTDTYLRRRAGHEQVSYPDPRMAEALGRTQGCFAAETRVVTKTGVREIRDLAGGRHDLMTRHGGFIESEVRSFGVQPLRKIILKRNKQEKVIHATVEHRWFAKWHDKTSGFKEALTDDLKPGMVLQSQMPWKGKPITPSPFGIAAGITFGDGARSQWQCFVDLHGDKNAQLLRYFSQSRVRMPADQDRYSEPYVQVLDLPRSWKDHPRLDEGQAYLLGWMAGYFAADGCVDENGQVVLASAHRADAEAFRTIGHRVGVGTFGIRERQERVTLPNGEEVDRLIHYVSIVASTVTPDFFLVEQHRDRFVTAQESRTRVDRVQWTVVSVEETNRVEEVFCAVVRSEQAFVLEDNILTGNCILYQEQIMAACANLAGYTLEEADGVRRILGKKKVDAVVAEGQRFLPACIANGMGEQAANLLWAQMAEFAKYSFNRSHAWGYAVLGYWTAWLKFHYPAQFLAAALSTVDKERIPEFITEAKRQGYEVLPPDVNASARGFTVEGTAIRYGLEGVAGIAEPTANAIIEGQPYTSYEDFAVRKPVNVGVTAKLASIGAFDSMVPNRRGLEERLAWEASKDSSYCRLRDDTVRIENDLPCTFDWATEPVVLGKSGRPLKGKAIPKKCSKACRQYVAPTPPDPSATYTDEEIRNREMEMLGVWLSSTPFDDLPEDVRNDVWTAEEVEDGLVDNDYLIAGYITAVRPTKDRHGADMGFVTFNAQNGLLDCVVFKDAWSDYSHLLRPKRMVFASLRKDNRSLRLQVAAAVPNTRPRQGVPT